MTRPTRRDFFGAAAGGALLSLGDFRFLTQLPVVSAAASTLPPGAVRLSPDIEPLVRLLEDTPRERLLEEVADRIRRGLTYREVITALLLAGVRNVQPRPSVGFKFHTVLAVHSVHLASAASPDSDRWLPIFWALDYFKDAQARDASEGDWTMRAVDESAVPPKEKAREAFCRAMEAWDEPAADAAAAGLARTAPLEDVFELFYGYGARDFRSIGHKAIFAANSRRMLSVMDRRHFEPVLRSLAYAQLMHEGENPARRDAAADRSWRRNQGLARRLRADWREGRRDEAAAAEMLAALRQGSADDVCDRGAALVDRGIAPASLWDAVFAGAAELLARQPGIVALHAVTTTNALAWAFDNSRDDLARRLLLLQGLAFLPHFREAMGGRGPVADRPLDKLQPLATKSAGAEAVEEIFAEASRDRHAAARKALAHLQSGGDPKRLIDAARRLVFLKGSDAHDYKFSSAVLEDYLHVAPAWRDRYLAASLFWLRGSGERDNALVERTRAALGG